jgi:Protein of unknown function (DUF3558)
LSIIVRRLVVLIALLLGTASCGGTTGGSPVPGPGGGTTAGQRTTTATRSTPSNGKSLAGRDPCALLSSAAQAQLGISGGQRDDQGSARGCKWRLRGPEETWIFGVDIRDSSGIKDLPKDGKNKDLSDIGSHKAVQRTDPAIPGSCTVILGVTETSRVSNVVTAGVNQQKACELASQMARLVEPELP